VQLCIVQQLCKLAGPSISIVLSLG